MFLDVEILIPAPLCLIMLLIIWIFWLFFRNIPPKFTLLSLMLQFLIITPWDVSASIAIEDELMYVYLIKMLLDLYMFILIELWLRMQPVIFVFVVFVRNIPSAFLWNVQLSIRLLSVLFMNIPVFVL